MHRFRIDAIHDPGSLPRIAGFFAQRAIVPTAMRMEAHGDFLRIEVTISGLDEAQAAVIGAKLGEPFAVMAVKICRELAVAA